MNLLTVFLTGLLTGGLTCLAVQGGLLAATLAQREQDRLKEGLEKTGHALPIIFFLIAKIIAYTVLGFMLGWVGSFFKLSITFQIILQTTVAIFMIGTALNMLKIHPVFRYFAIQPPRFLTRLVRNQSKSRDFFAPVLVGAFTIFIPCGTTQAMMALAIGSGKPVLGALIMLVFTLGTSPLFFTLGYLASKLGSVFETKFVKIAALAIILLAVFNFNSAVALSGSKLTLENIAKEIYCTAFAFCNNLDVAAAASTVSEATINFERDSYNPDYIKVKAGSLVTLKLVNKSGYGCIQAFTIPLLNYQKVIPPGSSDTIEFTAPSKPQDIAFMCGMGMFRGVIHVI